MNFLLFVHVCAAYVQILDPSHALHLEQNEAPPGHAEATWGRFDRQEITREYTLIGWFQVESFQSLNKDDLIGILSTSQWFPCVTITDTGHSVTVTYDSQQFVFAYNTNEVDWYLMAAWVDVEQSQYGICIQAWDSSALDWNTETYTAGVMRQFDRSAFTIDFGKVITNNVQFVGQLFDIRLYNQVLSDITSISTTSYDTTACHTLCNGDWWGPANTSCNDFIQIVQPYEQTQISGNLVFDPNDNYFQKRTDYGINNSFTGYFQEDSETTQSVQVFKTASTSCPSNNGNRCHSRIVYYNAVPTATYTDNALNISYEDDPGSDNDMEMKSTNSNTARTNVNFITASFSSQNMLRVCFGLNVILWQNADISGFNAWDNIWPVALGDSSSNNVIRLGGTAGDNALHAKVADVRYYLNKELDQADFLALRLQAVTFCQPGCLNCPICDTCADGYYYDTTDALWYMCHEAWAVCTGPSDLDCSTCASGYKQLQTEGWCTTRCPSGYTDANDYCQIVVDRQLWYRFDSFDQTFQDIVDHVPGVLGTSYQIESSDPILIKDRGFYFDGVDDQVTLEYQHDPSLVLSPSFSIFFWANLRPIDGYVLGKFGQYNVPLFSFSIVNEKMKFSIRKWDNQESSVTSSNDITNEWKHFGVTWDFQPDNDKVTNWHLQINGNNEGQADKISNDIIYDVEDNQFLIGTGFDINGEQQSYMQGFIYDFMVYNSFYTPSDIETILNDQAASDVCQGDWTFCPEDTLTWINPCNDNEYIFPDGSCGSCLASCSQGCINPTDCNLCEDDFCVECAQYGPGQCIECEDGYAISGGLCVPCQDDYWLVCAAYGIGQCSSCQPGYTIFSGICVVCDDVYWLACSGSGHGRCTECETGYAIDSGSTCRICDDAYWLACTATGTGHCSSWQTGYALQASQCGACDDVYWLACSTHGLGQCTQCQTGYAISAGYCVPCDDAYCLACSNAGLVQCTECYHTFTLNDSTWLCQYNNIVNDICVDWPLRHQGVCVAICPIGWIPDVFGEVCIQCPDNCSVWSSQTECDLCNYSFVLREDLLCYHSCPNGQFATENGECSDCFDTWETCVAGTSDDWVLCPDGLARSEPSADVSSWYCQDTSISTKNIKFACIDQQMVENVVPETIMTAIEALVTSEELTEAEFHRVISQVSRTNLYTTSLEERGLSIINEAGLNTMTNYGTQSITATTDRFDVILTQDDQQNLQGARIFTSTGSGLQIPSDLVEENYANADAELLVNVIQLKSGEQDSGQSDVDIMSIEIYELAEDTKNIHFQSMKSNFTMIFAGQQFNTTEDYEWVYLESGSGNWETFGWALSFLDSTQAACNCNHLSSFSLRKGAREANTDTNAASTTDFEQVTSYDLTTNLAPTIFIASILVTYFVVFFILRRADKRSRRVGLTRRSIADEIHAMALAFQRSLEGAPNMNESESESPSSSVQSALTPDEDSPLDSRQTPSEDSALDSYQSSQQQEEEILPTQEIPMNDFNHNRSQTHTIPQAWRESSESLKSKRSQPDEIRPTMDKTLDLDNENFAPSGDTTTQVTIPVQTEESDVSDIRLQKNNTITADGRDLEETSPEKMAKKSLKRQFIKIHPLIGIFSSVDKSILRTERWTIFLAVVFVSLYVTGLFYNADYDEDEEKEQSEKSIKESFESFSWDDFWVIVYTTLITVPLPFILRYLFRRRKPDTTKNVMKQDTLQQLAQQFGAVGAASHFL